MRTTSTPDLAGHLGHVIARSARRLRQESGSELSPSLSAALATVDRHGPITPSELAQRERIQRPTVTRLLRGLEEAGLVARTPDPHDRRSSLVAVTAAGRALMAERRTRKTAYLARRLDALPPDDRAALERAATILERVFAE